MKIVVMSDTHLGKATDEFKALCSEFCDDADMVIHLGDLEKVEMLNYLEQYPLEAVAGNMDDYAIQQRLPGRKIVKAGRLSAGNRSWVGIPCWSPSEARAGVHRVLMPFFSGILMNR